MKRTLWIVTLAIFLFGGKTGWGQSPNIIVLLADDLGYNDVSCFRKLLTSPSGDQPTCTTPNIDKLAANGVMFTNFYSGNAVCSPSRGALLTGRNSSRLGIYNWIPPNSPMHLRSTEVTIAEMLKTANYCTAHFGKWHLTSDGMDQPIPNDQGFDYSFFTYNNAEPSHKNPVNFRRNGKPLGEITGYSCQIVADEAIQWMKGKHDETPFYINLWFHESHVPLAAPENFKQKHLYNKEYYGVVENLDSAIGRVLAYLESAGLEENTIVMFASDNGSEMFRSNDPFRGQKHFNYEGGIRTPFIFSWPSKVKGGNVEATPGAFVDVLPSLAAIVEVEMPPVKLDGQDLSAVLLQNTTDRKREKPIFFHRYFHDPVCMLRDGNWVLLGYDKGMPYKEKYSPKELALIQPALPNWRFNQEHMEFMKQQKLNIFELYDVANDPGQKENLAEKIPEITSRLKQQMLQLKDEVIDEGGDWFQNKK